MHKMASYDRRGVITPAGNLVLPRFSSLKVNVKVKSATGWKKQIKIWRFFNFENFIFSIFFFQNTEFLRSLSFLFIKLVCSFFRAGELKTRKKAGQCSRALSCSVIPQHEFQVPCLHSENELILRKSIKWKKLQF